MIEVHPTAKEISEAIDRIARTPDGAALYVLLQRRLMTVSATPLDGALYLDQGERMFASKLISFMKQGIHESGGRTSTTGSSTGGTDREQPLVVPGPEPRAVNNGRSSGRRVDRDTIVPGWNDTRSD